MKPEWVTKAKPVASRVDCGRTPADFYKSRYGRYPDAPVAVWREELGRGRNEDGDDCNLWRMWKLYDTGGILMYDNIYANMYEVDLSQLHSSILAPPQSL